MSQDLTLSFWVVPAAECAAAAEAVDTDALPLWAEGDASPALSVHLNQPVVLLDALTAVFRARWSARCELREHEHALLDPEACRTALPGVTGMLRTPALAARRLETACDGLEPDDVEGVVRALEQDEAAPPAELEAPGARAGDAGFTLVLFHHALREAVKARAGLWVSFEWW